VLRIASTQYPRFGILLKGWGDAEIILEDSGDGAKFIRHLQEPVKETLK